MSKAAVGWALASVALIAACTATPRVSAPPASAIPSLVTRPSAAISPATSVAPTAEALPSDLDPEIVRVIEFRRALGLRHDLAYVLAAAADPLANASLLDLPLYPAEEQQLLADQANQGAATDAIQAYAARHRDEFGGVFIDRDEHPGVVVALWTDHLAQHEAAVRAALGGKAVVAMREVRYSEAYLRELQEQIVADSDWMTEIPADLTGVGAHISDNVVVLEVSSAKPDAVARIAAHYDMGDALRVESDGTGVRFIPWGTVKGKVVGPDGGPVDGDRLILAYAGDAPGECGGGDIGFGVGPHGRFEYPCQVGDRIIIVSADDATGDGSHEVGRASVTVTEGVTKVTIRLTEHP